MILKGVTITRRRGSRVAGDARIRQARIVGHRRRLRHAREVPADHLDLDSLREGLEHLARLGAHILVEDG